jgi:hypothetical protein
VEVGKSKLEDFADSHSPACHQFKHQPVSDFRGSEYDFIDGFFVDYIPMGFAFWAVQLFKQRMVTGIIKLNFQIIESEIEEGGNIGKTAAFCVRLTAFRNLIEKSQDMVLGNLPKDHFPVILAKFYRDEFIRPNGIFFLSWYGDNPTIILPLLKPS